ncbi:MAG: tetratricopeptide repeat protein [Chloroflexota bacterium]
MRTKLSAFCDKIIEAGWLAIVVAVPLFFNIYSARTFEPDKITLLRSIVSIMILAWLISVIERGLSDEDDSQLSLTGRFRRWLQIPFFLPTLLLALAYIISTILSISPTVSLWGSYQRMQGTYSALSYLVVFALMAGNLRTRAQVDRLVTLIIITSIPVSLYGIVQRYGLDPLPWAGDVTARVASNMGNAIFVASYLIMIVPLTLARLVESMTAIVKEEQASWGHTILAAVYIFAMAVQLITVAFSQSRGPMLGFLGASFIIGLLILLILRQRHPDQTALSVIEISRGIVFVAPLVLATAVGGGLGYLIGRGLQSLLLTLNYQVQAVAVLGAGLGGLLGFLGLYAYMAAAGKGWRWLWLSWLGISLAAGGFALVLNLSGTGLDVYLDPVRRLPILDRLSQVTGTESGTGKVRVLIWDAALELVVPHQPIGIPGDEMAGPDRFNSIRPLVGYGPESMFNAFALVYPPGLAHVEARGSSADRSHNETMDSLVITGGLGFVAFYFLMVSVFYYALLWLGWLPDKSAKRRLLFLLLLSAVMGAIIPYFLDATGSRFTFVPVGLPFGLIAGLVLFLIIQGLVRRPEHVSQPAQDDSLSDQPLSDQPPAEAAEKVTLPGYPLLLIGLLGALIGHFIEVHFVFSIAATYTYFWVYAGLMMALARLPEQTEETTASPASAMAVQEPAFLDTEYANRRSRKGRSRRAALAKKKPGVTINAGSGPIPASAPLIQGENLVTWTGSQGLAMAIIFIILVFDFVTPQFQFDFGDRDSLSLLWMFVITWLIGLAITLAMVAIRSPRTGEERLNWWQGVLLITIAPWVRRHLRSGLFGEGELQQKLVLARNIYSITSLGYFFFYVLAHRLQFSQQVRIFSPDDVLKAANILANGLVVFDIFLMLLMVLSALMLSWHLLGRLPFWRSANWWLYPPLVLAILVVIWFKNINVVRADVYLKEGERYRNNGQWDQAILVHDKARAIDSDEDFYYLMLALDYQLMAQDQSLDATRREFAWQEGERIALAARRINPYNPDNTGNMGRYYFTLAQVFSPERFSDALTYFEKATVLAPSNVIYHNLWAQTLYILQNYQTAVERLQTSISIDERYPPTWLLLGDTYAALGNVNQALAAHTQAIELSNDFFDQFIDQRLNFYISAERLEDILALMQRVAQDRPADPTLRWAIGHAYNLSGRPEEALPNLEQAYTLGDNSERTIRELANTYLALNQLENALPYYQLLLQNNPNHVEAHSALAYIYAQQGRLDEAIQQNQLVLQQVPNDYDSLKNLAILYQQLGRWQEALDAARQAQTLAPESDRPSWQQLITDLEKQLAAS